jgi:hypothetical protein
MKIIFYEEAYEELEYAIDFYNEISPSLADKFKKSISDKINQIKLFPFSCQKFFNQYRKCILLKFPYAIIYTIENNNIYIIAIANTNKKPFYWKKRK